MEWQKWVFLGFLAAVAVKWIPLYINYLGIGEDVYNHVPGPCRHVPGIEDGSEDIQTLPNGLAFISTGLGRAFFPDAKPSPGKIYTFNMNSPKDKPVLLSVEGEDLEKDLFSPHGIGVLQTVNGTFLFVVNHHPEQDRIEKFKYDHRRHALVHMDTYIDNRITSANDVVAISENSFYFTNFLYTTNKWLQKAERYLAVTWGSVFYWEDDHRPQLVVRHLKQPNGITISKDNRFIYVAHEGGQEILIYERQPDNGLLLKNSVQINTPPDNIYVNPEDGDLWVAGHPVYYKVIEYYRDPSFKSPSQVLHLHTKGGKVTEITEVYANDGSFLQGSSVANYYKGKLLVGTLFHKMMYCELSQGENVI